MPPKGYFDRISAVLSKYDIALCIDEVVTGIGRTGNMFGCETFGIDPDTITLAKGLSSAYMPISALVIGESFYHDLEAGCDASGFFGHGQTYAGHPVAAAVANTVLDMVEEQNVLQHVRAMATPFSERLDSLLDHPLVGDVRSVGLLGGFELIADKDTRRQFPASAHVNALVGKAALERGVVVRPVSGGDSIAVSPALTVTAEEIDTIFDVLTEALDAVEKNGDRSPPAGRGLTIPERKTTRRRNRHRVAKHVLFELDCTPSGHQADRQHHQGEQCQAILAERRNAFVDARVDNRAFGACAWRQLQFIT